MELLLQHLNAKHGPLHMAIAAISTGTKRQQSCMVLSHQTRKSLQLAGPLNLYTLKIHNLVMLTTIFGYIVIKVFVCLFVSNMPGDG